NGIFHHVNKNLFELALIPFDPGASIIRLEHGLNALSLTISPNQFMNLLEQGVNVQDLFAQRSWQVKRPQFLEKFLQPGDLADDDI
ncbi:MAG: hypothetical protein MUO52_10395, partial [Desulfobacterales bacterium]|nr:hypothetical protein [Desulfobacterales bacterium]